MSDGPGADPRATIFHRSVEPREETENEQVLRAIAEIEDCETTELPPLYSRIDDMLDDLFGDPPIEEAQVEVSFSYYGYRITVDQEGNVAMRRLGEKSPVERAPEQ